MVTLADALLAFPIAYYMARVAIAAGSGTPVHPGAAAAVVSYLVRSTRGGRSCRGTASSNWTLGFFGLSGPGPLGDLPIAIVFTYIWLPYMILPLYAGLERIPTSLRRGVVGPRRSGVDHVPAGRPAARLPGARRGFDLHVLPDARRLHHPDLVSDRQFIGNVIYDNSGVSGNVPFAAAYSMLPVAIMVVYLLVARRLGAFESL